MKSHMKSFAKFLDRILPYTYRGAILTLCLVLCIVGAVALAGCSTAQVQADIQKVITLLPTAVSIAGSIVAIIAVAQGHSSPGALSQITSLSTEAQTGLNLAKDFVSKYQTNLASAPAGVIGQVDAAVATSQQDLSQILSVAHVFDANTVAAVNAAVVSVNTIMLALIAILPAAAVSLFPKMMASVRPNMTVQPQAVSARSVAKVYNRKITELGFSSARVHVPWFHLGPIPVLP